MNKLDEFDKALQGMVNAQRMKEYGHPAVHFSASAAIKDILRQHFSEVGDPRLLHALDMIADKMVRLCHSPTHFDSWLDIAGYARTAVMVLDYTAVARERELEEGKLRFTTTILQGPPLESKDDWRNK